MSESDTTQAEQNSTGNASSTRPNRRRVLQGIGAAGAAIAVGAGGSAATEIPESRTGGSIANDAHPELDDDEIPTSAQFWSFNNADMSVAELIQACADAGYHSVEPYELDDEDAIATALDETDVVMGSAHVGSIVSDIENDPAAVADTYSQFGDPVLIDPIEDDIDWTTRSEVESFADRMNSAAADLADEGLTLGYHNHDHEFQTVGDGTVAYDVFAENLSGDVHLQIDAGWVRAGGEDPIQYIIDYASQVGSIHMKNVMNGDPAEIDEGIVGMRGVATAARRAAGVDYLIYEYDNAPNPMESMETGADWLNKLNGPWEPGGICAVPGFNVHPAKLHRP
jgi:sugar phosphate isomerase/epimerase